MASPWRRRRRRPTQATTAPFSSWPDGREPLRSDHAEGTRKQPSAFHSVFASSVCSSDDQRSAKGDATMGGTFDRSDHQTAQLEGYSLHLELAHTRTIAF